MNNWMPGNKPRGNTRSRLTGGMGGEGVGTGFAPWPDSPRDLSIQTGA